MVTGKINTSAEEFCTICMILAEYDLDFRESSLYFSCKNTADGIFCVEMTGIDDGHTQFLCFPKLIVLYICGNEGIAAGMKGFLQLASAGTAAHGYLVYRFATISILKTLTAEYSFHCS